MHESGLWLEAEILFRLAVSMLLSGALGWEREVAGKPAGIRTQMLVGMGATLFMSIGQLMVREFQDVPHMNFDPIRIVQSVVVGVGFLGAGTIFVGQSKQRVRGLTTAASIWTTTGIGLAVGLERYLLAAGATAMALTVLAFVQRLEVRLAGRQSSLAGEE